jgi:mRNA interferase RelE/StbE
VNGYAVSIRDSAAKAIRKLPRDIQRRVTSAAEALAANPRPSGAVKLTGHRDLYRIRVGDWRIVYAVDDPRRIVDVRIVAHRREVYRDL